MILVVTAFILGLITLLYQTLRGPKTLPPGPILPLPLLTRLPWSKYYNMDTLKVFDSVRREYGDVFSVHLGYKRVVMLSDFARVKRYFAKTITTLPEDDVLSEWRDKKYGVGFINGEERKTQRNLFLDLVNRTAFDRDCIDRNMELIWPQMREVIEKSNEENKQITFGSFETPLLLFTLFSYCDPSAFPNGTPSSEMLESLKYAKFTNHQWSLTRLWHQFPFLQWLLPNRTGFNATRNRLRKCYEAYEKIIQLHEQNPSESRNDFVDLFLEKTKPTEDEEEEKPTPDLLKGESGRKVILAALDNALIGGEGVANGFNHTLFLLSKHPKVQERIRQELHDNEQPYCKAFVMEVLRYGSLGAFGGEHQVIEDLKLKEGYVIPTKTDVFPNLYHICRDEEHWKDPEEFRPERFLNEDGSKIITDSHWLPFSTGMRMCPASNYVVNLLMMLTSRIVGEYEVGFGGRVGKGWTEPEGVRGIWRDVKEDSEMEFHGMSLILPKPYAVTFAKI